MDRARLIDLFLVESREHLGAAHASLERIADRDPDERLLRDLMRHAHSLKGMAMSLGFDSMERLAHAMEDLFESAQREPVERAFELLPLAREGLARLGSIVDAVQSGAETESSHAASLAERIRCAGRSIEPAEAAQPAPADVSALVGPRQAEEQVFPSGGCWRIELLLYKDATVRAAGIVSVLRRLDELGTVERADPPFQAGGTGRFEGRLGLELRTDAPAADLERELGEIPEVACFNVQAIVGSPGAGDSVEKPVRWARVRADLLDSVQDKTLSLIHEHRRASSIAHDPLPASRRKWERSSYLLRDLYDATSELRLVPFQDLAQRLSQTVQEVAGELSKPARLRLEGGSIRLDRSMLDALVDPLQHMIRNALDHGIEPSPDRTNLGKPAEAPLTLRADRRGERIRVSLQDDGRGMDAEALRKAAVRLGLLDEAAAGRLGDEDALRLATLPAMTTTRRANRFSGRGVGLDVVRDGVERLGGRLSIQSRPERGTRIVLDLPHTLSLIRSLLVRCGSELFAVPISRIRSSLGWKQEVDGIETASRGGVMMVRLAERLSLPHDSPSGGAEEALLLDVSGGPAGMVVDEVIGSRDIVVRPLGPPLNLLHAYSGAALLDDGSIVLLLDTDWIVGRGSALDEEGRGEISSNSPALAAVPAPPA